MFYDLQPHLPLTCIHGVSSSMTQSLCFPASLVISEPSDSRVLLNLSQGDVMGKSPVTSFEKLTHQLCLELYKENGIILTSRKICHFQ